MAGGDNFMAGVKSAGRGAGVGAKIGTAIAPGIGTIIGGAGGALIGGGIGAGRENKKRKDRAEVQSLLPSQEDPTNSARMSEINQIARNISAGTDSLTQTGLDDVARSTAGTQSKLVRATGGNVGGTVDALLKSQRVGDRQANQVLGQAQTRLPFFQNMAQNLADTKSQRKLELQLLNRAQVSAENAQDATTKNINREAAFATGEGASQAADAAGRIKDLVEAFKNRQQNESGVPSSGGGGFNNPNSSLNQVVTPSGTGESVLGSINPAGAEVTGLGSSPTLGAIGG